VNGESSGDSPGMRVDQTVAALMIGTVSVLAALVLTVWSAVFTHPADPVAPSTTTTVTPQVTGKRIGTPALHDSENPRTEGRGRR
jgi:hypothetical protein